MEISKLAGFASGLMAVLMARGAAAQIVINDSTEIVTFEGFTGAGFSPTPAAGQLSSNSWAVTGASDGDLAFGGTATTGDLARGASPGGITTGGIYAFSDDAVNRMLGIQASTADFTPATVTARFINDLSRPMLSFDVSYRIWVLADEARSTLIRFSYSKDGVAFTDVADIDYTTYEAIPTTPEWRSYDQMTTLAVTIPDGEYLYLRWTLDDLAGSGSRDEVGLDDITINVLPACGDGLKEGAEACDDGNASNEDDCLTSCVEPECGDGYVQAGVETCDPPPGTSTECCSISCQSTDGNSCSVGTCEAGVCVSDGAGGQGGEPASGGSSGEPSVSGQGGEPASGGSNSSAGMPGRAGRPAKSDAGSTSSSGGSTSSGGAPGAGGSGGASGMPATGGRGATGGKGGSGTGGAARPGGESKDSGGCGCEVPGRSNHSGFPLALGLALVAWTARRRRAHAS